MQNDLSDLEGWREAAACLGSDISFFPSPEDAKAIATAKMICGGCPVADECLSYAIETNQHEGIWGGHTSRERVKLRRRWLVEIRRAG
jgi:WhiB family redox-sensing transcriptional regulator